MAQCARIFCLPTCVCLSVRLQSVRDVIARNLIDSAYRDGILDAIEARIFNSIIGRFFYLVVFRSVDSTCSKSTLRSGNADPCRPRQRMSSVTASGGLQSAKLVLNVEPSVPVYSTALSSLRVRKLHSTLSSETALVCELPVPFGPSTPSFGRQGAMVEPVPITCRR